MDSCWLTPGISHLLFHSPDSVSLTQVAQVVGRAVTAKSELHSQPGRELLLQLQNGFHKKRIADHIVSNASCGFTLLRLLIPTLSSGTSDFPHASLQLISSSRPKL